MSLPSTTNSGVNCPPIPITSSLTVITTPNCQPQSLPLPLSPIKKCSRNSASKLWIQEQQRKSFMHHLTEWSLNHDSSPHFHGKISLLPQGSKEGETLELGKSVNCILTDTSFTDARRTIVIRLFPPQNDTARIKQQHQRRDSADLLSPSSSFSHRRKDSLGLLEPNGTGNSSRYAAKRINDHYKMVVRCGSGWISSREYFSKVYFTHLPAHSEKAYEPQGNVECNPDASLRKRSQALGPPPEDKDSVVIRPLFRPFLRLPRELQEMILLTAVGWTRKWDLTQDRGGLDHDANHNSRRNQPPINLATMFCISKTITNQIRPWIYHSTDFAFGITGFTSFLWHLCPSNRFHIRRLTFHFGSLALLHCIRWLAPDPIFDLFEPPVNTNPFRLQFFWRMQLQDLVRDLHLDTLTIDIADVPKLDLAFVVRLLKGSFASVKHVIFIETIKDEDNLSSEDNTRTSKPQKQSRKKNKCRILDANAECLGTLDKSTWRELCKHYFNSYRNQYYFLKLELMRMTEKQVDELMDCNREFFDEIA